MKQWTGHDAMSNQLLDAGQFNEQQRRARGQMAGLDRSQLPVGGLTEAMVTDAALHKVWTFVPWDTGVLGADGEQTRFRAADADTHEFQFMGVTYQAYGSGWVTAFETTLTPFRGGSLQTEWFGNTSLQIFFTWTIQARQNSTPIPGRQADRYVGLRILYNGMVVSERIGPAKPADCFRILGESQLPSGNVTLTLQYQITAAGPDDAVLDTVTVSPNKHLMQAHLWGNRVVCVGRWR
jgi:hypothetical protein